VNILRVLEECIEVLQFKAQEKGIELYIMQTRRHPAKNGGIRLSQKEEPVFWPESINSDESKLKQILINLIQCALQFTETGYVRIYSDLDERKRLFKLAIEDSGMGQTNSQIRKLFNAFSGIPSHQNSEPVGFGLTISKSLARVLNGDI
jgi:signal transduction histidine kinase